MINLLDETIQELADHGKTLEDVLWVGGEHFTIPMESFVAAADTEYNCGFGAPEVAQDLVIVLKDGSWLERADYDGSEWWEFKKSPRMPGHEWDGEIALTVRQADGASCGWEDLRKLCVLAGKCKGES